MGDGRELGEMRFQLFLVIFFYKLVISQLGCFFKKKKKRFKTVGSARTRTGTGTDSFETGTV